MECHNQPLQDGERAKIWRADDLGDIELLHARYIKYSFARHTHEGAAIGVIEEGAESFYYRGAIHVAPKGHVVVFNPNEAHTGEGADRSGWCFRMFYLDAGLLKKAAEAIAGKPRDVPFFKSPIIRELETGSMLRRLHMSLEAGGTSLERKSRFLWTFAQIAKRHPDDPSIDRSMGDERSVVRAIRTYLEEHYTENVTLEDLSSLSGLSGYHLIRVFRADTGLPPHAYLEQIRVNRARLLLRTGAAIAEVALSTGFNDQSHFSRHFKKMTGVTPGQYQKTAMISKKILLPGKQCQSR
jgi:AraC-like DNA-binding protein